MRLRSQTPKTAKLAAPALLGHNLLFLFNNYALDTARRELRSRGALINIEPQVFDLLTYLIEQRDHVVSKDDLIASVWKGRIVSDSTLDSRVNAARKAVGDSGEKQDTIRTIARKGLRFVASVRRAEEQPEVGSTRPVIAEKQKISFCRSKDNVSLALASVGAGVPLIKTANWLTHLEYDWESPVWSPLLHWLASKARLVRYDGRGTGLSDMNVEEISFSSFLSDFDAVADATGFEKFNILGISQGAAIAIDYVVRHPERVSKLIISWRLRAGPQHPRRTGERRDIPVNAAPRLGRRALAFHACFRIGLHSERFARTDPLVRRAAANDHVGRERCPHSARLRQY